MIENKIKSSFRWRDIWALILYMILFLLSFKHIGHAFSNYYFNLSKFPMYVKIYCAIFMIIIFYFIIVMIIFIQYPYFTSFILFVIIPIITIIFFFFKKQIHSIIEIHQMVYFLMLIIFIFVSLLLMFILYLVKRVRFTRFMIMQSLKYIRKMHKLLIKLFIITILKLYGVAIILEIVKEFIRNCGKENVIPNFVVSLITVFTIIGTIKILAASILIQEIDKTQKSILTFKKTLNILPTIYVHSFLFPFIAVCRGIILINNREGEFLQKRGLLKYIVSMFTRKRTDFVLYYSLLHNQDFIASTRKSSQYLRQRSIKRMMSYKIVYITLFPTFMCFSLAIKDFLLIWLKYEKISRITYFTPAILTSIIFIGFFDSIIEFLIFLYVDRPLLLQKSNMKVTRKLQNFSEIHGNPMGTNNANYIDYEVIEL